MIQIYEEIKKAIDKKPIVGKKRVIGAGMMGAAGTAVVRGVKKGMHGADITKEVMRRRNDGGIVNHLGMSRGISKSANAINKINNNHLHDYGIGVAATGALAAGTIAMVRHRKKKKLAKQQAKIQTDKDEKDYRQNQFKIANAQNNQRQQHHGRQ